MLDLEVRVMNRLVKAKEAFAAKLGEERGDTNIISVIIILVIVIALAATFKTNIEKVAKDLWTNINSTAETFTKKTP